MTNCPYCGHKINTQKELPDLAPREFKIFNLLLNAGRSYTKIEDITKVMGANSETTARVAMHYMAEPLRKKGMRIANHKGVGYRLEEL